MPAHHVAVQHLDRAAGARQPLLDQLGDGRLAG
jgi:hypothetical protein